MAVSGNFQLEVQVVRVSDPVDDCRAGREGLDVCQLYIDEMCLDPQSEEQDCSLIESTSDLDLDSGLPRTRTLTVTNQPWPVSRVSN